MTTIQKQTVRVLDDAELELVTGGDGCSGAGGGNISGAGEKSGGGSVLPVLALPIPAAAVLSFFF